MTERTVETNEKDDDQPRLSRHWLVYLAALLAILGLVLVVIGYSMSAYTDPVLAELIKSGQECERGIPNMNEYRQCDSKLWHRSMQALRTCMEVR